MSAKAIHLRISGFRRLADFRLHLEFSNGERHEVDLQSELRGQVFAPLQDPEYFRLARLNPETATVEWPNGADFAPEFLYGLATSVPDRRGQGRQRLPPRERA